MKKNKLLFLFFLVVLVPKTHAQDTSIVKEKLFEFKDFSNYSGGSWRGLEDNGFLSYKKITLSGQQIGILKKNAERVDTLTKAIFDDEGGATDGCVRVFSNSKAGLLDSTGKLIIPIQYDDIYPILEGRSFVKDGGKYALVNNTGKLLTQFIFDEVSNFELGIARITINEKSGYIDRSGKYIVQPQFNDATNFSNGFAKVFYDKWETIYKGEAYQGLRTTNVNLGYTKSIPFVINRKGIKIFSAKGTDDIVVTDNDYLIISRPGYSALIDTTGKVIVPFEKKLLIVNMTKNWIIVRDMGNGGTYGILNYQGKELLKPVFGGFNSLQFNGGKLGKAYYGSAASDFFYIDKNCNCVEFNNVKCPDKE